MASHLTSFSKAYSKHILNGFKYLLLLQAVAFSHYALSDELDTPLGKINDRFTLIDSNNKRTEVSLLKLPGENGEINHQIQWTLSSGGTALNQTTGVISFALLEAIANALGQQSGLQTAPPDWYQPQNILPAIIALALSTSVNAPVPDTNLAYLDFSEPVNIELTGASSSGIATQATLSLILPDDDGNAGLLVMVGGSAETFHVSFSEPPKSYEAVDLTKPEEDDTSGGNGGSGKHPKTRTGRRCCGINCFSSSADSGDEACSVEVGSTQQESQDSMVAAIGLVLTAITSGQLVKQKF